MVNKRIIDIINKNTDKKSDEDAMTALLIKNGFPPTEIYEAIKYAKDNGIIPTYQAKSTGNYNGALSYVKRPGTITGLAIFFLVIGAIITIIGIIGITVNLGKYIALPDILEKVTMAFRIAGIVLLMIGTFHLITGYGLWNNKRWGRTMAIIAAVFMFFSWMTFIFGIIIMILVSVEGKNLDIGELRKK